jgi:hypothetical protein
LCCCNGSIRDHRKIVSNIEPPSKAPEISGNETLSANVTAIGPKATIAPTEVPVAVDRNPALKDS